MTAMVTSCGASPPPIRLQPASGAAPPASSGALPRYQSVEQLNQAVTNQLRADRGATFSNDSEVHTQPVLSLTGSGTLRSDDAGFAMQTHQQIHTPGSAPTDLWMVMLPDMSYLRAPPEIIKLPPATPWIAVPPGTDSDAGKALGPLVDLVRQSVDPTRLFSPYGSALSLVQAGPEQLDGTPTMHYLVRLDVALGQLQAPGTDTRQVLGRLLAGGLTSMDIQLWLDGQNRLNRIELTAPVPSAGTTVLSKVRYQDWGQPVTITAPAANQLAR
ncbi:MAG TPA: hypothetical protein VGH89_37560 [Pseudonocardia sp.]